MKKLYTILLAVLLAAMLGVGIWSLADTDPTGSVSEKRTFQKPQFSVQALLDGTYIPALETYYSDTFPGRETLLEVTAGRRPAAGAAGHAAARPDAGAKHTCAG